MNRKFLMGLMGFILLLLALVPLSAHEGAAHGRIGYFVMNAPNMDIYLDGVVALSDFAAGTVSDYLELEPGTHEFAVAPTGQSAGMAALGSVEVEADHNYSFSVIGPATDSLQPLVIDETAAMEGCDLANSVFRILINNVEGLPAVSFYENDQYIEKSIPYGGYKATCAPAFFWDTGKAVEGKDLDKIVFDFDNEKDGNGGFWEPYTVYFWGLMGKYPGSPGEDYTFGGGNHHIVAPDVTSFLSAFSGKKLSGNSTTFFEFDTAVKALQTAGLDKVLAEGGPYTIFVPTDQAFAALAPEALDQLMADPQALANTLKYHVVEGGMTYDDLVAAGTVATLQGESLTITASEDDGVTFGVNGATVEAFDYPSLDGTHIYFIDDQVLMPAK